MSLRILDIPPSERPRERLLSQGPRALSDAELLAILLGSGVEGSNAVEVAQRILSMAPPSRLLRMAPGELRGLPGVGPARACVLTACFELARRAEAGGLERPRASSPEEVVALVGPRLRGLPREVFVGLYLDGRGRVVRVETLAEGTADAVLLHPREVFRPALSEGACGVVLVHNHPSGDPAPSGEDRRLTQRLAEAGRALGVPLVDHIVVGAREGSGRAEQRPDRGEGRLLREGSGRAEQGGFVSLRAEGCPGLGGEEAGTRPLRGE
ncbi:MAG: DNA repair protein RadC [Euryarchaeota archaeon]|nr:DNA repair protein RadC [Euryarchaeota archaeon]